ncbi:LuxR family transcriptional regulator [Serratia marcescens]|uniref:helix-turn-helix transcriptional regulator n=1 Tax=Serratia TaxID=613 RepID=UPI000CA2E10E|nr:MULTISPECIES: LuxR family transcriptional regulator [Serratia]AUO01754.1 LuxR family transcriptional regulator [Serratia marcescens]MBE4976376.1 LuxR family transcriptional regulator [Serratia sp. X3]MCH6195641.1 LuxR family transcriptional regulator [Serratia sp. X10]
MFSIFNEESPLTETLRDYINRKLSSFSELEYAYTVVRKKDPSKVLIISSYPNEWVSFYRANNLQLTDPVILTAFKRASPFSWDENITLMSDLKITRIFTFSKRYNIVNGFTFVLHDPMNNLALLSILIGDNKQSDLEARLISERGSMQMLLIDINEQMYRLLNSHAAGKALRPSETEKTLLTPRENEILYWASMGKTYGETATIIGVSLSTVKFHMSNVVLKFGVSNAKQAIRLGAELGLIIPATKVAK